MLSRALAVRRSQGSNPVSFTCWSSGRASCAETAFACCGFLMDRLDEIGYSTQFRRNGLLSCRRPCWHGGAEHFGCSLV